MRRGNFKAAAMAKAVRESNNNRKARQLGIRVAGKPTPKPRAKLPRCHCGCGKAAVWPYGREPVFHTRLCGYLYALKLVQSEKGGE